MVVEAIHHQEIQLRHYELHAYVVMANHVHLLITPYVEVSKLMKSLKRFTAREANKMLGLTGSPFWQEEGYDRLVRDPEEFDRGLLPVPRAGWQPGLSSMYFAITMASGKAGSSERWS